MATIQITRSTQECNMLARIIERNSSVVQRLTEEVRNSFAGTLLVSNGGRSLTFVLNGPYDGEGYAAGDTIRYDILGSETDASDSAWNTILRVNETTGVETTARGGPGRG